MDFPSPSDWPQRVRAAFSYLKNHGFTMAELVLTIVVVGIIAGFALAKVGNIREKAAVDAMKNDLRNYALAQEQYFFKQNAYGDTSAIRQQGFSLTREVRADSADQSASHWYLELGHTDTPAHCFLVGGDGGPLSDGEIRCPGFDDNDGPSPAFSWAPSVAMTHDTVFFDASGSIDSDGFITDYEWDLGDGTTATGSTTENVYENPGEYTIQLQVTDDHQQTTQLQKTLEILNREPQPAFTFFPTDPTVGEAVQFDGTGSTDPDGTVESLDWAFGDGDSGSGSAVTHTYDAPGSFTVVLTATDDQGDAATIDSTVTVDNPAPSASFTWSPSDPNATDAVAFDASASSDPNDSIATYDWSFPGGTSGSGETTTHSFSNPGEQDVTLTVTDQFGATDTEIRTVSVGDNAPTASFNHSPASPVTGEPVTFDGTGSTDVEGSIDSYSWDFGDGSSGTGSTTNHTYDGTGNYEVVLVVTDAAGQSDTTSQTLTLGNDDPTASFTVSPTEPVTDEVATFDGSGSNDPNGTIDAYDWAFGDGSTGSGQTATHAYSEPGDYTVELTVTDNDGATHTATKTVTVPNQEPSASFSLTPSSPQTGESVSFDASGSDDPDGSIDSYSWTFGDGATGSGVSPTHTYSSPGTYTVELTVTDNSGATATATRSVEAQNRDPSASIVYSPTPFTTGESVTFDGTDSDDPDGVIQSYSWAMGDGTVLSGATVTHAYASPGDYTVTLTVTDDQGAQATSSVTVTAQNRPPSASFDYSPSSPSTADNVAFDASLSSDPDDGIASYSWTFGDGATATGSTPTHSYDKGGTYTVTLTVTDGSGSTNSTSQDVSVANQAPTASVTSTPNPAVTDETVTLDGSASGDADGTIGTYEWTIQGAITTTASSSTTTSFSDDGLYPVVLRVQDDNGTWSAPDTVEVQVTNQAPSASFTFSPTDPQTDESITLDASGSSDADGTIDIYEWTVDEGTPTESPSATRSVSFASDGAHTVELRVQDDDGSWSTVASQTITVTNQAPTASLAASPDPAQTHETITFDGSGSTDPDGSIDAYEWTVDGGAAFSTVTATLDTAFASNGDHTVALRVQDDDGDWSPSTSVTVSVTNQAPSAFFTYSPSSPETDESITLDASGSSDPDGSVVTYEWTVDGGAPITTTSTTRTVGFSSDGDHTVALRVQDDDGAWSTVSSKTITVLNRGPTASFTASPTTTATGDSVSFDASGSSDPDGSISSYSWDFGDASPTGAGVSPAHAYSDDGSYTVTLTVTDDDGAEATATETITVTNQAPTASFTSSATTVPTDQNVSFDASGSSDPDGSVASYTWDFGDGATATGATPSHSWGQDGSYTVTLTVADDDGTTDQATETITVTNQAPSASVAASPDPAQTQETITFDGSGSSDPDGSIATYEWTANGGTAVTTTDPTYARSFANDGSHTMVLRVRDDDDVWSAPDTVTVTVTNQAPSASFTKSSPTAPTGTSITFDAAGSDDPDGSISSYSWDFGDGATATGQAVGHAWSDDGTYTVTLTVTDDDGVSATATDSVTISNRPANASFTASSTTVPTQQSVSLDASGSSDPDGSISSYSWDFGDGATATGATTSHSWGQDGSYTVTLTLIDDDGASSQATETITVTNQAPTARIAASDSSVATHTTVTFDASTSSDDDGTISAYAWDFDGDGTADATTETANYSWSEDGTRLVTLTVTDDDGAVGQATVTITVTNQAPTGSFTYSPSSPETDQTITLDASSSSDADGSVGVYEWTIDGGTPTTTVSATRTVSFGTDGSHTVELRVQDDDNQWSAVTSQTISVANRAPSASFTHSPSNPESFQTVVLDGSASSDPDGSIALWEWTLDDNDPITATDETHGVSFTTSGEHTVELRVQDNDGAWSGPVTDTITVSNQAPSADFSIDPFLPDENEPVTFDGSGSADLDGNITNHAWDFTADGVIDTTGVTVQHAYSAGGSHTARLIVTDNSGAVDTAEIVLDVNQVPTASFALPSGTLNPGESGTFDASFSSDPDGSIVQYCWQWISGAPFECVSADSAIHNYSEGGSYDVTLRVTDDDGGQATQTQTLEVNRPPEADFSTWPEDPEAGDNVQFSANPSSDPDGDALDYHWKFQGGFSTDEKTFWHTVDSNDITVFLRVTDEHGLQDSVDLPVVFEQLPAPTHHLNYDLANGEHGSTRVSATLSQGMRNHTGVGVDGFTVDLLVSSSGTQRHDGVLWIGDVEHMLGDHNGSFGVWEGWADFNPMIPTSQIWDGAPHRITLVYDGSENNATYTVYLDGTAIGSGGPLSMNGAFTDGTELDVGDGPGLFQTPSDCNMCGVFTGDFFELRVWNVWDGDPMTYLSQYHGRNSAPANAEFLHSYYRMASDQDGSTLVDDGWAGNTGSIDLGNNVHWELNGSGGSNSPPTASVSCDDPKLEGATVTCTASASDSDGDALSYSWSDDFSGSGSSSSESFGAAGTYTATVTVSDGNGGSVVVSEDVTVEADGGGGGGNSAPTVSVSCDDPALVGETVTCTASASDPDNDPLTYEWGNDFSGTGTQSSRSFATAGTYHASVTVSDGNGGSDGAVASVTINNSNSAPSVSVSCDDPKAVGETVTCTASGSDPDDDALSYSWSGDFSGSGTQSSRSFSSAGTYTATVTASDGSLSDQASTSVTIEEANGDPSVSVSCSPDPADLNETVTCTASASDPDGDALSYSWSGAMSGSGSSQSASYSTTGSRSVTVTVSDGNGGSASSGDSFSVEDANEAPTVDWSCTKTDMGGFFEYNCDVIGTDPDGDVLSYSWKWDANEDGTWEDSGTGSSFTAQDQGGGITIWVEACDSGGLCDTKQGHRS